jgi:DNA polymerase elongation subunit (family B)
VSSVSKKTSLADELEKQSYIPVRARILILDIETQRAIVETWTTYKPFITIDNVIVDSRILCFAAKWHGEEKVTFRSSWDEDAHYQVIPEQYEKMMRAAFELLDEADVVITYNGDRFDNQWLQREFSRLGLGRPLPSKSIDLMKINKKWFKKGQLSLKLDWSVRKWLGDKKVEHGASDLWHDIRYGTREEKRASKKLMREYNIHDTVLTGRLFNQWLPWASINVALYENEDEDGLLHCTKCNSTNLTRVNKRKTTNAFQYHMFRCKDCGAPSSGKRSVGTTELRPV